MDVWCIRCDNAVLVPTDDAMGSEKGERVRSFWSSLKTRD